MKKIESLEELHLLQLDMMDSFDSICRKNGLTYFLAGGTLLGAIRHKGFIPWDDDVDLSMPRPDYERLIKLFDEKPEEFGYLSVDHIRNKSDYVLPFARIVNSNTSVTRGNKDEGGLFIDIFPIDGFGNDKEEAQKLIGAFNDRGCRIGRSFWKWDELSVKSKLVKVIYICLGREKLYRSMVKDLCKNNFYESEYIGSTFGLRGKKEIIERHTFEKTMDFPFEDRIYKGPVGYDQYLKQMYGDYMELPPIEKRVPPHELVVYVK